MVMLPRTEQSVLDHIEFVALSANRILVILVVNDREVQNRIINTDKTYSASKLQQVSKSYLNKFFTGKNLIHVRKSILEELEKMKEQVNQSMQSAIEMVQKTFDSDDVKKKSDDLLFSGQTDLT